MRRSISIASRRRMDHILNTDIESVPDAVLLARVDNPVESAWRRVDDVISVLTVGNAFWQGSRARNAGGAQDHEEQSETNQ